MKQRATSRNKKAEANLQLTRAARPRSGFLRPPGLPMGIKTPRTPQMFEFFDEYVKTGAVRSSAIAAGYSESWASKNAYDTLREYQDYVAYLQKLVIDQRAKVLALDTQTVLDEIARIGMANEFDYIVIEEKEFEIDGKKQTVKQARRKHLHEMTRDEMVAIKIYRDRHGELTYDLRDKEAALLALGKNLGLFNDKLIIERRNLNVKAKIDLSNVPSESLAAIIKEFENVAKDAGAQRVLEAQ